ncbi:hypothetical protein COL154_011228 [Colletotrichum chrysophilum]|uniref:uncharacterized protein n=1 Tax=Colletotrichum chrysophilum TaxID=1836956 RepID=UPI0023004E61|nr:uncharacterized protein COL26b_011487 [Colletotrichum chrysophilum]KAJ0355809.1 hypothetical protein COL154_011228 [Colletotrichum chrysophilum]KAJ0366899.1 hypothetical protein COL26b_011487 [Colletotrichum chrysophilum]
MSHNWRDKVYNEEWEKAETRHQEAMGQWRTIGTDVSELRKQVKEIQKDEKRKNMLEWLWEGDISVQYRAAREKYSKGTCEWLVQEGEGFKLWERDPKSFLWLNGKAGSGKSILSSSVIKYLKDQYEQNPETALAYYFFSFGNLEQQKVSAMLSSLVKGEVKKELIAKADGMFQYLICQFEILKDVDSEALVAPTLHRLPDGLDETYNRLLRDLGRRFQSQVLSSLKWLVLSRRPLHLDEYAEIFIFRPDTVAKIDATRPSGYLTRKLFCDISLAF